VSVKLTPEICINKASSNSCLTATGKWPTAADSHSQNCLQTLFFSLFLWWDNNWTTPACWRTYWNCIAFELGTLCGVFFVLCSFVLFWFFQSVSPLMRHPQSYVWSTISRIGSWRMNTKIIKMKLYCIWTWRFIYIYFFIYLFFIFILFIYLFIFFIFNPLSVSLMPCKLMVD
jgi:hypothetical protein